MGFHLLSGCASNEILGQVLGYRIESLGVACLGGLGLVGDSCCRGRSTVGARLS